MSLISLINLYILTLLQVASSLKFAAGTCYRTNDTFAQATMELFQLKSVLPTMPYLLFLRPADRGNASTDSFGEYSQSQTETAVALVTDTPVQRISNLGDKGVSPEGFNEKAKELFVCIFVFRVPCSLTVVFCLP